MSNAKTLMTEYDHTLENLVEVTLTFDCYCYAPYREYDGTIGWKEAYPNGEKLWEMKVKLPQEAIVSQDALEEYLADRQNSCMGQASYFGNPTIYVG